MHWYPLRLGDHLRSVRLLSMLEEGAFIRLANHYFDTEKPLPIESEPNYRIAIAATTAERRAVDEVLRQCFVRHDDGWRCARFDKEIEKYQSKSLKAKRAADIRWADEEELDRLLADETNRSVGDADASAMRSHNDRIANKELSNSATKNPRLKTTHSQPKAENVTATLRAAGRRFVFPEAFVKFWNAAPRRKNADKAKTFEAYQSAVEHLAGDVDNPHAFLLTKIKLFAEHYKDTETIYTTNAKNWLRDLRWEDEYSDKDD